MEEQNKKLRDEIERQSGEQTEIFAYLNKELRLVCAQHARAGQGKKSAPEGPSLVSARSASLLSQSSPSNSLTLLWAAAPKAK
jgi:hypothetical protein